MTVDIGVGDIMIKCCAAFPPDQDFAWKEARMEAYREAIAMYSK
jgi:hypothetical protein